MKKLHITRSDISSYLICGMLQIPKALEEFTLSIGGLCHIDGGVCTIESEGIANALRQHRLSLKTLDLSFEDRSWHNTYGTSNQLEEDYSDEYEFVKGEYSENGEGARNTALKEGIEAYAHDYLAMDFDIQDAAVDDGVAVAHRTIGSLHEFTALTNLSVSLGALLGFHLLTAAEPGQGPSSTVRLVDVLPPNLEYLRVYDYQRGEVGYFDEQIDDLLRQRAKFPKLTEITGVDAVIEEMKQYGGEQDGEESAYELPERDFSWKVVA